MHIDLSNILKIIGPAASIIFAAWIFMGFLQQRYDSAVSQYREIIREYRTGELTDERRGNIKDLVLTYRRRCTLMMRANLCGLVSAVLFILTLIAAEVSLAIPGLALLQVASAGGAAVGFAAVIVATVFVIMEGLVTQRQLDSELLDIPDLAHSTGQEPGDITAQDRGNDFGSGLGRAAQRSAG
jgi:hypothetical protein